MIGDDLVAVPAAARLLGLSVPRIWSLIAAGALPTVTVGGRHLVPSVEVERLAGQSRPRGRPLPRPRVWALLALLSGEDEASQALLAGCDRRQRRRLAALASAPLGLDEVRAAARFRSSSVHRFAVPDVVLERIRGTLADVGLVTGAATRQARVAGLRELVPLIDAYVPAGRLAALAAHYRLQRCFTGENLVLRPLHDDLAERLRAALRPDDARVRETPVAVVAVDLLDDLDERRRGVGADLLRDVLAVRTPA